MGHLREYTEEQKQQLTCPYAHQFQLALHWTVLESPRDSDHCPILVTQTEVLRERDGRQRDYRNISWDLFKGSKHWENISNGGTLTAAEMVEDFYNRLTTSMNEATVEYTVIPFFPKPWWNGELTASLR